jgi:hypothetical protein
MALGTTLPFGLRDVKLIKYPDLLATAFGTSPIDLPNAQTFEFAESEEYTELRGDDKLITSHGNGAQLDCSLESGGVSIDALQALDGGTIIETGISPNQKKRYRKISTDQRPFLTIIGQSISDSGGDFHGIVYLGRATGDISFDRADAEFMIPSVDITGYPCRVTGLIGGSAILDGLYDFLQNETITSIIAPVLDTPAAPTVISLDDITGPIAGGELIKVSGTGFSTATAVTVGGTAATDYTIVNDNQLWLITPAHGAGAVFVVVTNPSGASATGAASTYTYV